MNLVKREELWLEGGGVRFVYKDEYVEALEKQRDELLVALERFIDSHEECTDFDGFTAQIVSMDDCHEAQDAIARVKDGVDPKSLLPIERDCCGTFPRTPHRSTCKHYRGKKGGAA